MKDLALFSFVALNIMGSIATLGVLFMRKASSATLCVAAVLFMMSAMVYVLGHHILTAIILWFFCSWLWMWVSVILFVAHHQREEATPIHRVVELFLSILVSASLMTAAIVLPGRSLTNIFSTLPSRTTNATLDLPPSYFYIFLPILLGLSLLMLKRILPYTKHSKDQIPF